MKKKSTLSQEGRGYEVFQWINNLFFLFVLFITAYPIYYVLIASFSSPSGLAQNYGFIWLPIKPFTLEAYRRVITYRPVMLGFRNTFVILIAGLAINLIFTALGAYFLTLKNSIFSKPVGMLMLFTMYFGGGLIPGYLNVRELGMLNTIWSLILPGAVSTYNMLILRSAFAAVPTSLTEAATIDGATHPTILRHVMLPLTGSTMAVLVLYYGVGHWNSWFSASIYLQDPSKYPLALVLRNILIQNRDAAMTTGDTGDEQGFADLIKYALIVVSTFPILCLYPFLQRFFVKGVMIGALKG